MVIHGRGQGLPGRSHLNGLMAVAPAATDEGGGTMRTPTRVPAPLRVAGTRPNGEVIIRDSGGAIVATVVGHDRRYSPQETARALVERYNAEIEVPTADANQGALFDMPKAKAPNAVSEGR